MDVHELSRDQLTELKEHYLCRLADQGSFAEVVGRDYDFPSWWDMANANDIVPDDCVFREFEDIDFCKEDFFCTAN